ncbi:MAG TPA: S-adenosylmethionine:tRNA ribosyltransferase-isomerase [Candidatus Obscuribacterales bacterium]
MSRKIMNIPLPPQRLATRPPEARGLARDAVRMMQSHYLSDRISHGVFSRLPQLLQAGDVLVINTSGTLPAALDVRHADGRPFRLHLSTREDNKHWIVEIRIPADQGSSLPFAKVGPGDRLYLPEGAHLQLLEATSASVQDRDAEVVSVKPPRLWRAQISGQAWVQDWLAYLHRQGRPIRYGYVNCDWPLEAYQTVFSTEAGSAEMPSAGRAFTPELITALVARGIQVLPLLLHTGVSSLESAEAPYPEFYRVPQVTADAVNAAHAAGRRIIAVGTTAVRALESSLDPGNQVQAGEGWTRLMITPERGMKVVTGLLTGFHEPEATHLAMLEALAGAAHLRQAYAAALDKSYLWHEFGDLHLIMP